MENSVVQLQRGLFLGEVLQILAGGHTAPSLRFLAGYTVATGGVLIALFAKIAGVEFWEKYPK